MQRTLAYARSPAPVLPLAFLLTAPCFGLLAALLLAWAGEAAFISRWGTATLGATHLLTLGYLGMAMAGALLQLIPVLTGAALQVSRLLATLLWSALAAGALLLATALAANLAYLFAPAAALLACAFGILLLVTGRALLAPVAAAARAVVDGMRLALAGLAVTVVLGVALALSLGGWLILPLPVPQMADLHAAWGLLGWVAMLVAGVAFQIIPMFQSSRLYPDAATRWGPRVLGLLLLAWSAAMASGAAGPGTAAALAIAIAALLAGFAGLTWSLMAGRKGKPLDTTTLYWRLALASLAASALLAVAAPAAALATGIVFIGGFAMGAVNGMLYKIVPFLLWYHLQHDGRAAKGQVPPIRQILPDAPARRQFWCYCAALAALLGALVWPQQLALAGAALLALASLLLVRDLGRATLHCRAIAAQFQPA